MSIKFQCPSCGGRLKVPDEFAGKTAKCPTCSQTTTIPAQSEPEAFSEPSSEFGTPMPPDPLEGSNPFGDANPYAAAPKHTPAATPRRRGELIIKKIDVLTGATTFAIFMACYMLIFGIIYGLAGFLGALGAGSVAIGVGVVIGAIIFTPVIGLIMGFIAGAILSVLYNLAAQITGGLKIETG